MPHFDAEEVETIKATFKESLDLCKFCMEIPSADEIINLEHVGETEDNIEAALALLERKADDEQPAEKQEDVDNKSGD